jgi:hypothetical protein
LFLAVTGQQYEKNQPLQPFLFEKCIKKSFSFAPKSSKIMNFSSFFLFRLPSLPHSRSVHLVERLGHTGRGANGVMGGVENCDEVLKQV